MAIASSSFVVVAETVNEEEVDGFGAQRREPIVYKAAQQRPLVVARNPS
jgi:hypothetical protein